MWVADFIANGLRPWYTKFAATIDDRRWLGVVEDIYNWAYEVEPYLRNTRPVADVAMVFSPTDGSLLRRTQGSAKG